MKTKETWSCCVTVQMFVSSPESTSDQIQTTLSPKHLAASCQRTTGCVITSGQFISAKFKHHSGLPRLFRTAVCMYLLNVTSYSTDLEGTNLPTCQALAPSINICIIPVKKYFLEHSLICLFSYLPRVR